MFPPDPEPTPPRYLWLDWWFTPRWRALLTWLVLSGVAGELVMMGRSRIIPRLTYLYIEQIKSISPIPLPGFFEPVMSAINWTLLVCWIEPFALRLTPRRGAAWLALRLAPDLMERAFHLPIWAIPLPIGSAWSYFFWMALSWAALALVLRGWRTCPWMTFVGGVLALVVQYLPFTMQLEPEWLAWVVRALPNAVLLIYGTRLLRPEERGRA